MVSEATINLASAAVFDEFVHQAVDDWRGCDLRPPVRTLLEFAEKVTQTPSNCTRFDIEQIRNHGWSDAAIHDAVQVIAYFNYINRIADALGAEPEDLPLWGHRSHV